MNKILKTILISSIAVFGVCLLFSEPVQAQPSDYFVVEFEKGPSLPLFNEANFLPGDNISRWIKVTNNSSGNFKIATKVDKPNDSDQLGDVLNLEIKEGGTSLYNNTLSNFFNAGEVFLSDLAGNGTQTRYDYIISFDAGSGNIYQGESLSFDILIGYESVALGGASGGTYTFMGGGSSTTTTVPPTTTTIPGKVSGEATERESFEEGGEGGFSETTTTTTSTLPPSGLVFGESIIRTPSCQTNLILTGINPLLASLLCLGQNACKSCISPWLVLLLGLVITSGGAILVKKYHE